MHRSWRVASRRRFSLPSIAIILAFIIQFTGQSSQVATAATTTFQNISGPGTVALYGVYEATFNLSTVYSVADRFNPATVSVSATFNVPDAGTETVPGFFLQETLPNWAVRYSPRVPGTYTYTLKVTDSGGTFEANGPSFSTDAPSSGGFVTVDPRNTTRLKTTNGHGFVINGTNAAWEQFIGGGQTPPGKFDLDYADTFAALTKFKMNWARIFATISWSSHVLELGPGSVYQSDMSVAYEGLGKYNLESAGRTDSIFQSAQKQNVYIQWVLASYGDFSFGWKYSAYNSANGGPCAESTCFQTNPEAQAAWKNYLYYTFARWGSYNSLGMIEYINESDVKSIHTDNHVGWHQMMDNYWKSLDIYHRPTTTSYNWQDHHDQVGTSPRYQTWQSTLFLSATNQHRMAGKEPANNKVVDLWISEIKLHQVAGHITRPTLITVCGTGMNKGEDKTEDDPNGYFYHDAAWVPFFFAHAAGTNLMWRVDQNFQPHGVTAKGYEAFGKFIEDELPYLPDLNYSNPLALPNNVKVGRYQSLDRSILLFRDWDATFDMATPAIKAIGSYVLTGLFEGDYVIEFWDTMNGTFTTTAGKVEGDRLTFVVPPFQRAIAVKIYGKVNSATWQTIGE